jgi:hypothetical protein
MMLTARGHCTPLLACTIQWQPLLCTARLCSGLGMLLKETTLNSWERSAHFVGGGGPRRGSRGSRTRRREDRRDPSRKPGTARPEWRENDLPVPWAFALYRINSNSARGRLRSSPAHLDGAHVLPPNCNTRAMDTEIEAAERRQSGE